jgi:septal ring factor EnvC (AmiA/AmiB activator)
MNDIATKPRLSQESITILSVGGALLGTAVALGALILNTTGRIEHRIERVEHRIERVEDRLLAVEKETASLRVEVERVVERMLAVERETASLRVDVTELRAGLDHRKAATTGTVTEPPPFRS